MDEKKHTFCKIPGTASNLREIVDETRDVCNEYEFSEPNIEKKRESFPIKGYAKYPYSKLLEMAGERSGELLTTEEEYNEIVKNQSASMAHFIWKCNNPDHPSWPSTPSNVNSNRWCRQCYEDRRGPTTYSYSKLLEMAGERGGELLTTEEEYNEIVKNQSASMAHFIWKCNNPDHPSWPTSPRTIVSGSWCPKCGFASIKERFTKYTYSKLLEMAGERGGELLTTEEEYNNLIENGKPMTIKFQWKCSNPSHPSWFSTPRSIETNRWCRGCGIVGLSQSYEDFVNLAKYRGIEETGVEGRLLTRSDEFLELIKSQKPSQVKLEWSCDIPQHPPWKMTPNSIKQGSWCPTCSEGKSEQICRWYCEKILAFIFNQSIKLSKISLNRIISDRKIQDYNQNRKIIDDLIKRGHTDGYYIISFDGYELKIGMEFNGHQHYIYPNRYHGTKKQFLHRQYLDSCKGHLFDLNCIILLEVSELEVDSFKDPFVSQQVIINIIEKALDLKVPDDMPFFDHKTSEFGQYRLDPFY